MQVPKHIAIIMDGNGRWAQRRALPRVAGHHAGVSKVRATVEACIDYGVKNLTLFAFSTENWARPQTEVGALMTLFVDVLDKEIHNLHEQGVRVRFIGARQMLAPVLQERMAKSEAKTELNDKLTLVIAIAYGGRDDIVKACQQSIRDVLADKCGVDDITAESFRERLSTYDLPEPDLFIRTGGEKRISNFLLWDLAYTELWFTDTLWPAFDKQELMRAIEYFSGRERRFGLVSDQIKNPAC
jgi:undecaprenyl diphosphate synthase